MPITVETAHDDFKSFTLLFLMPVVLVAFAFNLYLSFARPWVYYRDDARYVAVEQEDWLLVDSAIDDDTPVPATSYNTVKEAPLSPDEVSRLLDIIRADKKASSNASVPGRKRKAGEEAVPWSNASSDEGSPSPRARKLKIDTNVARWVTELPSYGACLQEDEHISGPSEEDKYQFTFRAPHPDRPVRSASKGRRRSG
ncbi:MAG: hypothetical protein L6R39_003942 [Caloplaca ligustica]|nr:MAG: hypothetical protein L6R39_003942 [Caloplaca ligustica]